TCKARGSPPLASCSCRRSLNHLPHRRMQQELVVGLHGWLRPFIGNQRAQFYRLWFAFLQLVRRQQIPHCCRIRAAQAQGLLNGLPQPLCPMLLTQQQDLDHGPRSRLLPLALFENLPVTVVTGGPSSLPPP